LVDEGLKRLRKLGGEAGNGKKVELGITLDMHILAKGFKA